MKTSKILLFSGAGFLALLIIIVLSVMKISIAKDINRPSIEAAQLSGKSGELQLDTSGVSVLELKGAWKVQITQGFGGTGTVRIPEELKEKLQIQRHGKTLEIGLEKGSNAGLDSEFSINLNMETLYSLRIDGAADGLLKGFNQESLQLQLQGAMNLRGVDIEAGHFSVTGRGANNLEFSKSRFKNISLDLEGASNVELKLDGGVLDGRVEGIGSVHFTGTGENRLKTEGLTSVSRG